jgi:hypothetical protein
MWTATAEEAESEAAPYVFISYHRGTEARYVAELTAFLNASGLHAWFDKAIDPGERWERLIRRRIDNCAAFVVVMTPSAETSDWVAREITRAEKASKPIFPLLRSGEEFFRLSDLQYEDVTDGQMPSPPFIERLRVIMNSTNGQSVVSDGPDKSTAHELPPRHPSVPAVRGKPVSKQSERQSNPKHRMSRPKRFHGFNGAWLTARSRRRRVVATVLAVAVMVAALVTALRLREPQDPPTGSGASPQGTMTSTTKADLTTTAAATTSITATTSEPETVRSTPAVAQFRAAYVLTGHRGSVWKVIFQPGSDKILASGGGGDLTVRLWDASNGKQVKIVDTTPGSITGLAFSPDGGVLAAAIGGPQFESGEVRLWSMETGELIMQPLSLHQNKAVYDVAFSPDGKMAASGGGDDTVRLWNSANGTPIGQPIPISPQFVGTSISVAFSREGILAYNDGYSVVLWNPAVGAPIGKPLEGHKLSSVTDLEFSPDGRTLASAGGDIRLWNVASGSAIGSPLIQPGVQSLAFSPNGTTLASVSAYHKIMLWNSVTGTLQQPPLTASGCDMDVAFNTSGTTLAAACGLGDDKVRTWAR